MQSPTWRRSLAYGAVAFASSAINNVFVTYYIDLFTGYVQLTPAWFYAGQLIFMVWNAVNDPLLGWLSDTVALPQWCLRGGVAAGGLVDAKGRGRRALAIRWGGILWSLSFLLVWWPWAGHDVALGATALPPLAWWWWWWPASGTLAGLHFVIALCLYDGFLTFTEVNQEALLTEMSVSERERAEANAWAAGCGALGATTSILAHVAWQQSRTDLANGGPPDLSAFRFFASCLAVLSAIVFEASARALAPYDRSTAGVQQQRDQMDQQQQYQLVLSPRFSTRGGEGGGEGLLRDADGNGGSGRRGNVSVAELIPHPVGPADVLLPDSAAFDYGRGSLSSSRSSHPLHEETVPPSYLAFARQLAGQANFRVFAAVQFTQQFDCE